MSIAHDFTFDSSLGHLPVPPQVPVASSERPLHRIADVRRRQGVSVRSAARRMHTSIDQVRRQEDPSCDMLVSELLRWQQALEVPVSDLLVESEAPLSEPVLTRARLLRIMKTVQGHQRDGDQQLDPAVRDDARAAAGGSDAGVEGRCGLAFDRSATIAG